MTKTLVSEISAHFSGKPDHPAQRHKQDGQWHDVSYQELGTRANQIAAGLCALGIEKGDRTAILSHNCIAWAHCDLGMILAGCITVTIYPTSIQREVAYILENSDARVVFVENDEQLDKVLKVRDQCPELTRVVVMHGDVKDDGFVLGLEALREKGREHLAAHPDLIESVAATIAPEDLVAIIYTSGTTGPPKGVMLTHNNIVFVMESATSIIGDISQLQLNLSFLPLSHALERIGGHFLPLYYGRTIGYAESLDTIGENFREIRPDMAAAVPRVFEKVYARIQDSRAKASPLRQKILDWALKVGKQTLPYRSRGQDIPFGLKIRHALADKLVYGKIREVLGGNMKYFISGGAPLDAQIAEFFFAMGVVVMEAWGATETAAPATFNQPDAFRIGSVGLPLPQVEVRVEEDGELLVRGPNVCKGYWKMPEQSAETFDTEGWYHSGDVGRIDEEGFVYITDRKKELIITAAGKNISPQNIENKLKLSPWISNAMAVGDRRKYVSALITLDAQAVAEAVGAEPDHAVLADRDDVKALVDQAVKDVNADLPRFEQLKKFRIPTEDFTVEKDELSPSLKLKRRNIVARYENLINTMYDA